MKRVFNRRVAPIAQREKLEHLAWGVHLVNIVAVTTALRCALTAPVDFTKAQQQQLHASPAHLANINWVLDRRAVKRVMSVHLVTPRSC